MYVFEEVLDSFSRLFKLHKYSSIERLYSLILFLAGIVLETSLRKWSGRGAHIHIHPNAFSPELYSRIDPLDVAYSVTEYVLRKVTVIEGVKVENKIDLGRVFTTPLSIHRELDRVAVCIDLDKLEEFDLSWTEIDNFRHSSSWRRYEVGEADELADKAFTEVGPYIYKARRKRVHKPLDKQIIDTFNRFKDLL